MKFYFDIVSIGSKIGRNQLQQPRQTRQKGAYQYVGRESLQVFFLYVLGATATGLSPGGSSTVHIYTQTIRRTTQLTQTIHRTTQLTNWEECGP